MCQKSGLSGTTKFLETWIKKSFLGKGGSLIISLLQCYVVLWIHDIDAFCISQYVSLHYGITKFDNNL